MNRRHQLALPNLMRLFRPWAAGDGVVPGSEMEQAVRFIFPAHQEAYEGRVVIYAPSLSGAGGSVQLADAQSLLLSVYFTVVTSAVVGNRTYHVNLIRPDSVSIIDTAPCLVAQAASLTKIYVFGVQHDRVSYTPTGGNPHELVPLPRILLEPQSVLQLVAAGNQAGDVITPSRFVVLERG